MLDGFCAIATRNAAMLYEALRRLPHMARILMLPASLIGTSALDMSPAADPLAQLYDADKPSGAAPFPRLRLDALLLRRAHLLKFDQQQDVVHALHDTADQQRPAEARQGQQVAGNQRAGRPGEGFRP